jgi:hypothetical protein
MAQEAGEYINDNEITDCRLTSVSEAEFLPTLSASDVQRAGAGEEVSSGHNAPSAIAISLPTALPIVTGQVRIERGGSRPSSKVCRLYPWPRIPTGSSPLRVRANCLPQVVPADLDAEILQQLDVFMRFTSCCMTCLTVMNLVYVSLGIVFVVEGSEARSGCADVWRYCVFVVCSCILTTITGFFAANEVSWGYSTLRVLFSPYVHHSPCSGLLQSGTRARSVPAAQATPLRTVEPHPYGADQSRLLHLGERNMVRESGFKGRGGNGGNHHLSQLQIHYLSPGPICKGPAGIHSCSAGMN